MENDIKKIEIITDSVLQRRLVQAVDATGVSGYTIIKDVAGKGLKGDKDGHGISGGFKNFYMMLICNEIDRKSVV